MVYRTKIIRNLFLGLICSCLSACGEADCEVGEKKILSNEFTTGIDRISKCLNQTGLKTDERARALQVRSWAYNNVHQDIEAIADLEAAFKLKAPSNYNEFINYGSILRRVKRYEDSLDALREAEKINQSSMMTQYNLGWTLSELGRYNDAVKAFSQGIPMQPDYPYVYWRRGLAFEALDQQKNAIADFEQAAQLFIEFKEKWVNEDLTAVREKLKDYGFEKKYPI